ncbi:MAG: hypothetical protein GY896_05090 [Gammaproteobacteria bacterium]|nr:hypothetical protein [Gammaproteobacteria bacterium]
MEPEVYQGMYIALTRDVERELFPCLRNYAMGWLVNHSLPDAELGDAITLGTSSVEHLVQNMEACQQATLDPGIHEILDRGWEISKPNCFKYFRP